MPVPNISASIFSSRKKSLFKLAAGLSRRCCSSWPAAIAAIEALRLYQDSADPPTYGAGTELTSGFVVYEDEGVIEHRGLGFVGGPKSIKVTYTGGYFTADAIGTPEDIRLAAIMQTKIVFDRREEFGLTGRP